MATVTKTNPTRKAYLTPNQLAELKKGPRANIVVGPEGDRYIGLESASVNLLAHFSPTARKKLVDERGTILTIPNGSKKAVLWIYKYMQAGEHDPVGLDTFEESLKKRMFGRLKASIYHGALPTVDEIKLYQTSIPELYDYALYCLSFEMSRPWTCNYGAYLRLAKTNEAFGTALGDAMQKLIASRVKTSEAYYLKTADRRVIWAIKYIDAVLAGTVRPKDLVGVQNAREPFNCYKCGGEGHKARNCAVTVEKAIKRPPPICYRCEQTGHIARNCTQEKPITGDSNHFQTSSSPRHKTKTKEPFICYKCGEEGHMARDCTVEVPDTDAEFVGATRPVRATAGRYKQFLHTQRPREIEVAKNGQGLATCDRKVR